MGRAGRGVWGEWLVQGIPVKRIGHTRRAVMAMGLREGFSMSRKREKDQNWSSHSHFKLLEYICYIHCNRKII